jgi:hypothetical protein
MSGDWYEVVSGPDLEQGDVLPDCPIFRVLSTPGGEEADVLYEEHDVVVLTQTCDLVNNKVEDVLVAAVLSYVDVHSKDGETNPQVRSSKFRKAAVEGNLPSYFLIPPHDENPELGWSLVDFHNVFSVPKHLLQEIADGLGDRLRLVAPYREHLAQGFARYIMRVGLPTTLHDFEKFDPTKLGASE